MDIKTVFKVDGETYRVNAIGQEAVKYMLRNFARKVVTLVGFLIDDEFKPADLRSHWERTLIHKSQRK
jgi:hypothetical protein